MPDRALYDAVAERLREGFQRYRNRPGAAEADMRQLVITPVLSEIGYSDYFRRPEWGVDRDRPDEICYLSDSMDAPGDAALIVEAKKHGSPFDKAPGGLNAHSPDRQIQRYLRQHPASGPDTIGVLTDGVRWRVYERAGRADIRYLSEYNFAAIAEGPALLPSGSELREFVDTLCRECILERRGAPRRRAARPERATPLLEAFTDGAPQPDALLSHLLAGGTPGVHYDLAEHVTLVGIVQDVHHEDWNAYAYALGAPLQTAAPQPDDEDADGGAAPQMEGIPPETRRPVVAAVRFKDGAGGLSRADTALCARTFARVEGAGVSVVLAYRTASDNGATEARLAVCANGATAMTAPFDPGLPPASARAAIEEALGALAADAVAPERLRAPLEVAPLRQGFYAAVSAWTRRIAQGRDLAGREAVLRHLIRVMFAWILKEDGLMPAELFEEGYAKSALRNPDDYHASILRFLFHDRLNVEDVQRNPHPDPAIDAVMEEAPFLNGSLFQEQEGDLELDIPAAAYWGADEEHPGLFTLFSRYHWTTDEHRPGESDQTLDPELLSNLFERLILPIESEEGTLDRQPRGTYYTPSDVVAEMVKDALAAAARPHAPAGVTDEELLTLFGDGAAPPPAMSPEERAALAARIHELRIFDPAVGSGAFLFGCLTALRTALRKLEPDSAEPTPEIIRAQLFGQDIHPLAAQITRLRLFIALKAADREAGRSAPLPNLEALIVCADTLETRADPDWRPDHPGRLDTANRELVDALLRVAGNRTKWLGAHTEGEKQVVLEQDKDLRGDLRRLLREMGDLASPELAAFAETPILPLPQHPREAKVARTDARLLFYEDPWRGFDIVIGNPPYEALRESMDEERRKSLKEHKRYQTTNCGDLYTLFCETALALAKPEGGVVTLIVPLSIAFGQQQRTLRRVFEEHCASIDMRHYDNRPDKTFGDSPTVRNPENRQRATILTAVRGNATKLMVRTTGLQRWAVEQRHVCLVRREMTGIVRLGTNVDKGIASQWARIPTPEVAELVRCLLTQQKTVANYVSAGSSALGLPLTAGYYLSTFPAGAVSPRHESLLTMADDRTMHLVMAALNGHVGFAWWRIFGDGFHSKEAEFTSLAVPDAWAVDPEPAINLGARMVEATPRSIVALPRHGTKWRNVDFHTYAPELVAEADRLYIEALGLPLEPLLSHLKVMRSNRSWDFR